MARTQTKDRDVEAQVLGSGNPSIQDETREGVIEQYGEDAYLADPERFWTAQHGPMPDSGTAAALGPQRYLDAQLPDPAVALAAGIPPQRIPETIRVADEDAWTDPRGPEPGEQVRLVKSNAVKEGMLREVQENPAAGGYFTLTDHTVQEIRAAQEEPDTDPEADADADETGDGGGTNDD